MVPVYIVDLVNIDNARLRRKKKYSMACYKEIRYYIRASSNNNNSDRVRIVSPGTSSYGHRVLFLFFFDNNTL